MRESAGYVGNHPIVGLMAQGVSLFISLTLYGVIGIFAAPLAVAAATKVAGPGLPC